MIYLNCCVLDHFCHWKLSLAMTYRWELTIVVMPVAGSLFKVVLLPTHQAENEIII